VAAAALRAPRRCTASRGQCLCAVRACVDCGSLLWYWHCALPRQDAGSDARRASRSGTRSRLRCRAAARASTAHSLHTRCAWSPSRKAAMQRPVARQRRRRGWRRREAVLPSARATPEHLSLVCFLQWSGAQ